MIDTALATDFGFMLVVLLAVGFLPSEVWRVAAAFLAQWVDEKSEVFELVRLLASSLIAAVIAKLLLAPPPALAAVPLWGSGAALVLSVVVYIWRKSLPLSVACGVVLVMILGAIY